MKEYSLPQEIENILKYHTHPIDDSIIIEYLKAIQLEFMICDHCKHLCGDTDKCLLSHRPRKYKLSASRYEDLILIKFCIDYEENDDDIIKFKIKNPFPSTPLY